MMDARIKNRLSQVRTSEEALRLWCDYKDALAGYTFVLAEPQGAGTLHFPARIDFPGGGHLRSVFAHDNLFAVNNELLQNAALRGQSRIRVDYAVGFDSNVASYLRTWHQGRSVPVVKMLQTVFQALNAGRFNWDPMPFFLERAADMVAGRDLDRIRETQLAALWFLSADRTHFAQTGDVRPMVSAEELEARAAAAIANWRRQLKTGMIGAIQQRFSLFHACILKIVQIQLENPSPDAAALKLQLWLEFMHNDLQLLLILPTRVALEFFQRGGAVRPMAKIAARSPRLRQSVRNVTWDFMHVIWRQTFAGFNARAEGLLIPYLLTFDHGLADLYALYPQRSCLFGNEVYPPQFFADMDLPALILKAVPTLEPLVSHIFSGEAEQDRQYRRGVMPTDVPAVASRLDRYLTAFEDPRTC